MTDVVKYKATAEKDSVINADVDLSDSGAILDFAGVTGDPAVMALPGDGVGGVTIGSTMTVSPETTAEDGYLTITIDGTAYQIPIYAA